MFKKIGIIGVGLMGGSFSLAFKEKFPQVEIIGFARNINSLRKLKRLRIVDKATQDLKEVVKGSGLIVLALPIYLIIDYLKKIKPFITKNTIVIDLGSTKTDIHRAVKKLSLENNFVGCHPLCGSEKSGAMYANRNLYKNSLCIITSNPKKSKVKKIKKLWESLEAKVYFLSPSYHDRVVSYLSHLPHIVSFSLAEVVPLSYCQFFPRSFLDMIRIATSSSHVWRDIFISNRKNIIESLDSFFRLLEEFKKAVANRDIKKVEKLIVRANKKAKIKYDNCY
ncbi:MAG: prephenate dehydrogenase/arogenate dehydrogenase family protein [Candidatus Omnitrophica bacterium]|nr:prephenate dehydrogenase/arogenate dehydrogenase family protein [Candidatus Omnitrophota bacterium]